MNNHQYPQRSWTQIFAVAGGESLDQNTSFTYSMMYLSIAAMRILHLIGKQEAMGLAGLCIIASVISHLKYTWMGIAFLVKEGKAGPFSLATKAKWTIYLAALLTYALLIDGPITNLATFYSPITEVTKSFGLTGSVKFLVSWLLGTVLIVGAYNVIRLGSRIVGLINAPIAILWSIMHFILGVFLISYDTSVISFEIFYYALEIVFVKPQSLVVLLPLMGNLIYPPSGAEPLSASSVHFGPSNVRWMVSIFMLPTQVCMYLGMAALVSAKGIPENFDIYSMALNEIKIYSQLLYSLFSIMGILAGIGVVSCLTIAAPNYAVDLIRNSFAPNMKFSNPGPQSDTNEHALFSLYLNNILMAVTLIMHTVFCIAGYILEEELKSAVESGYGPMIILLFSGVSVLGINYCYKKCLWGFMVAYVVFLVYELFVLVGISHKILELGWIPLVMLSVWYISGTIYRYVSLYIENYMNNEAKECHLHWNPNNSKNTNTIPIFTKTTHGESLFKKIVSVQSLLDESSQIVFIKIIRGKEPLGKIETSEKGVEINRFKYKVIEVTYPFKQQQLVREYFDKNKINGITIVPHFVSRNIFFTLYDFMHKYFSQSFENIYGVKKCKKIPVLIK